MAKATGRITIYLYGPEGHVLKKKTIALYGKYRFQLITAFKVLSIISAARDLLDHVEKARVEIRGVRADSWFVEALEKMSPIPIEIVQLEEVVLNGVVP